MYMYRNVLVLFISLHLLATKKRRRRRRWRRSEQSRRSGVYIGASKETDSYSGSLLMGRPMGRASCLIEFSLLRLLRQLRPLLRLLCLLFSSALFCVALPSAQPNGCMSTLLHRCRPFFFFFFFFFLFTFSSASYFSPRRSIIHGVASPTTTSHRRSGDQEL